MIEVKFGPNIHSVQNVDKYAEELECVTYDIDTTHICTSCGVFDFGYLKAKVRKKIAEQNRYIMISSRSKCPCCGATCAYMGNKVFQCDREIANGIFLLNKAGIETLACCAGHIYWSETSQCWKDDGFYVYFEYDQEYDKMIRDYVKNNCKFITVDDDGTLTIRADIEGCCNHTELEARKSLVFNEFNMMVRTLVGEDLYLSNVKIHNDLPENDDFAETISLAYYSMQDKRVYNSMTTAFLYGDKKQLKNQFIFDLVFEDICGYFNTIPLDQLLAYIFCYPFQHIQLNKVMNGLDLLFDDNGNYQQSKPELVIETCYYEDDLEEILDDIRVPSVKYVRSGSEIFITVEIDGSSSEKTDLFFGKESVTIYNTDIKPIIFGAAVAEPIKRFLVKLDVNLDIVIKNKGGKEDVLAEEE